MTNKETLILTYCMDFNNFVNMYELQELYQHNSYGEDCND